MPNVSDVCSTGKSRCVLLDYVFPDPVGSRRGRPAECSPSEHHADARVCSQFALVLQRQQRESPQHDVQQRRTGIGRISDADATFR